MKSLMIVELDADGHRMQHVRRIARGAVRRSLSVTLLTRPSALGHPAFAALRGELGDAVKTSVIEDRLAERVLSVGSVALSQLACHRMCRRYFEALPASARPDAVFVPYLDHFDKAAAALGSPFGDVPWGGLVMLSKFHYRVMGTRRPAGPLDGVKRELFLRLLRARGLRAVFTIDELLKGYVDDFHPALAPRLCYVGDPVDLAVGGDRRAARARLGVPGDAGVILAYGSITRRKAVDALVAATRQPGFPEGVCVLVVGRQDAEARAALDGPDARALRDEGRLVVVDRFVDDDEERDAFLSADMVWAVHRDFYGMSGVLIQAASMGLPVVASADGLVGWLTERYEIGRVVDFERPGEVAWAVAELVRNRPLADRYGRNGIRLALDHTARAFADRICDVMVGPAPAATGGAGGGAGRLLPAGAAGATGEFNLGSDILSQ